jgi:hypothetical protein
MSIYFSMPGFCPLIVLVLRQNRKLDLLLPVSDETDPGRKDKAAAAPMLFIATLLLAMFRSMFQKK